MTKLLIITDISERTGLGHWMRCYNLAAALDELDYEIHAVQSPSMATFDFFMPTDFIHWHLTSTALHASDVLEFLRMLQQLQEFDAVLIDGYQFSEAYRSVLKSLFATVISFDDINDCSGYHCDVLINSSATASQINYSETAPDALLLLGEHYRQMGSGYVYARQQLIKHSNWDERNSLTIIMGGADTHSLTLPLLQSLEQINWSEDAPTFNIITTDLYSRASMIHTWCKPREHIEVIHQQYDLSEVFMRSCLVITAAGGSAYEIQLCAAPSMTVIVEDNQDEAAHDAERMGWSSLWDWREQKSMARLTDAIQQLWEQPQKLKAMHNKLIFDLEKSRVPDLAAHIDRYLRANRR